MKPLLTTLALLASTLVARPTTEAQTHEGAYTVQDSLNAIRWASRRWHIAYGWLYRVALCESGLRSDVTNPTSGASGLLQFMPSTYYAYARRIGEVNSYWSPYASANVAGYMFSVGQSTQWVCR